MAANTEQAPSSFETPRCARLLRMRALPLFIVLLYRLVRRRKADGGRKRDPVGILARDIAAQNDVHRDLVDRPPAQAELSARLRHARGVGGAELAEYFRRQGPDIVGRPIIDASRVGRKVMVGDPVPQPAGIE